MNSHRIPNLIALLALTLALLAPAAAEAQERTVSASAEASLKVPNDTASLGLSVTRERRSRGAALGAVFSGLRGVIAAVQKVPGVGPGDVTTGRVSVRKAIGGKHVLYRAAEGIGVTLHKADNAGKLVSAAIGAGATGVSGPNFFVGDSERAFAKALAAAFDRAKARAATLATQAGATLGSVIAIDEGEGPELFPAPEAKGLNDSAGGCARCPAAPPPVKPGTSTVTATVHVVFALQ